jgi:2-keto-3-deoxygluconate permease
MKIKATIERIPGGMMLVPLARRNLKYSGSEYRCLFWWFHKRDDYRNSTDSGGMVLLYCASINLRATGTVLRKSGTLVITKIAVAWVVAMICALFIPDNGVQTGFFAGFSVLAIVLLWI